MEHKDIKVGLDNWLTGFVDGCKITAKVFPKPSSYGIDGGRISKLEIRDKDNNILVNYDRGWDIRPSREIEQIYLGVVSALENYYEQQASIKQIEPEAKPNQTTEIRMEF